MAAVNAFVVNIPEADGEPPKEFIWGYSVYVQFLPPNIVEEDLMEMGSCVGPVLELRLFLKKRNAHIRFTRIEHGIKFMEMVNTFPKPFGPGRKDVFYPLVTPGHDYPCLVAAGLHEGTTKQVLLDAIKRQFPRINVIRVLHFENNRGVVQFSSQREAKAMLTSLQDNALVIGGREVEMDWEGSPALKLTNLQGFKDKAKIAEAFDVLSENHVFGVACLGDRGFVYFTYRFRLEEVVREIGQPFVRVTDEQGNRVVLPFELI